MNFKILTLLIFMNISGYAQNYNKNYFRLPVNIPIHLAGNFGEIRTNHFHSGIDIKVPFIGLPLYAAADGYISRIRKSSDGYGNALYITHPNGLRTVYGHMHKFRKDIESYAKQIEYKENKFEITVHPDSTKFRVKKGDLIGYAGSSGRSYGPHVHFEIREADKDIPLNPELFNFKIKDNIKPKIFFAEIVPLNKSSTINDKYKKEKFKVYYKNGKYFIPKTVKIKGKAGIAINANDYMNGVRNTQGIFSVKMFVDDTLTFSYKLKKISFYETRYINSFIDYAERQLTKKNFQKLWKDPGNKLDIYEITKNAGILNFSDNKIHKIKIQLTDCYNNSSYLFLKISGKKAEDTKIKNRNIFYYNKNNYFVKPGFRASIKKGTLYKNIEIQFAEYSTKPNLYSNIYQLNSYLIPAQENIYYAIKPNNLPKKLISKALIVNINKEGNFQSLGGTLINDFIAGKCKCFGKFAVAVDTTPPLIKLDEIKTDNNYSEKDKISFIITDNLSGIKNYRATIDKKNIIFDYDKKNNKITYVFDNHITYNKTHKLQLKVTDKKNNKTVFNLTFFK
ncbi:MAG: M23 family metallopeptidase [Bacteroidales bacterium]|nr:M23 family metallopeptidase [Bacteroidales bacterium]